MAPEAPGNILVVETQFEGDKLTGLADSVDYAAQSMPIVEASGGWLDVYWNQVPTGDAFIPLGRGVVYVRAPHGYEIKTRTKTAFDSLGNNEFAYRHPARGEGFMFVLLLPEGFTLAVSNPTARSAKVFHGRLALYWKPDVKYDREVAIQWQLAPLQRNVDEERDHINRTIYQSEDVPTNAGAQIVDRTIFIGHGHSETWRVLKDFISEKLKLQHEEFNRPSAAGSGTLCVPGV